MSRSTFKELLSFAIDVISKNNQNGLHNINQFTLKPEINWKRYYFEGTPGLL